MTDRRRYMLVLTPPGDATEDEQILILRRVLKRLLRPHGWRCVRLGVERDSCHVATDGVHLGHGETDEGDSGGGEGERSNALRDRQGRGRGP